MKEIRRGRGEMGAGAHFSWVLRGGLTEGKTLGLRLNEGKELVTPSSKDFECKYPAALIRERTWSVGVKERASVWDTNPSGTRRPISSCPCVVPTLCSVYLGQMVRKWGPTLSPSWGGEGLAQSLAPGAGTSGPCGGGEGASLRPAQGPAS